MTGDVKHGSRHYLTIYSCTYDRQLGRYDSTIDEHVGEIGSPQQAFSLIRQDMDITHFVMSKRATIHHNGQLYTSDITIDDPARYVGWGYDVKNRQFTIDYFRKFYSRPLWAWRLIEAMRECSTNQAVQTRNKNFVPLPYRSILLHPETLHETHRYCEATGLARKGIHLAVVGGKDVLRAG
jgi:hypothetical protein